MSYNDEKAAYGNGISGGSQGQPATARTTLGSQVSAFEQHVSFATELAHRLGKIADQLFGATPTPVIEKNSASPPEPVPIALALERKHNDLGNVLYRISAEVQRIEERVN